MLTERQMEVLLLAARGHSNKYIAHELATSVATVATHVARAKTKLGVRSRLDLIRTVATVPASFENSEVLDALTPSERDVARAVLANKSNADIADERGRSARTVANQIASLFRKLGIGSRAELAALILYRQ